MIEHVISFDGSEKWLKDNKFHRTDGPAIVYANGEEVWYKNNNPHRADGPARIFPDGIEFWYEDDRLIKEAKSE